MVLIILALISLAVGLIRKGKLSNVFDSNINAPYLFIITLLMFITIEVGNAAEIQFIADFAYVLLMAGYSLFLVGVILNLNNLWMFLLLLGAVLNFVVIFINTGKMPISPEMMEIAGVTISTISTSVSQVVADSSTVLPFLGGIIPVPLFIFAEVISPGTLIIGIGLFGIIQKLLCGDKFVDYETEDDDSSNDVYVNSKAQKKAAKLAAKNKKKLDDVDDDLDFDDNDIDEPYSNQTDKQYTFVKDDYDDIDELESDLDADVHSNNVLEVKENEVEDEDHDLQVVELEDVLNSEETTVDISTQTSEEINLSEINTLGTLPVDDMSMDSAQVEIVNSDEQIYNTELSLDEITNDDDINFSEIEPVDLTVSDEVQEIDEFILDEVSLSEEVSSESDEFVADEVVVSEVSTLLGLEETSDITDLYLEEDNENQNEEDLEDDAFFAEAESFFSGVVDNDVEDVNELDAVISSEIETQNNITQEISLDDFFSELSSDTGETSFDDNVDDLEKNDYITDKAEEVFPAVNLESMVDDEIPVSNELEVEHIEIDEINFEEPQSDEIEIAPVNEVEDVVSAEEDAYNRDYDIEDDSTSSEEEEGINLFDSHEEVKYTPDEDTLDQIEDEIEEEEEELVIEEKDIDIESPYIIIDGRFVQNPNYKFNKTSKVVVEKETYEMEDTVTEEVVSEQVPVSYHRSRVTVQSGKPSFAPPRKRKPQVKVNSEEKVELKAGDGQVKFWNDEE